MDTTMNLNFPNNSPNEMNFLERKKLNSKIARHTVLQDSA